MADWHEGGLDAETAQDAVRARAARLEPDLVLAQHVALVVPILLLAHRIGGQAADINASLEQAVTNTAALKELNTTADHVGVIVAGLQRGRQRLGG